MLMLAVHSPLPAESVPFAEAPAEKERPERGIVKLPTAVAHRKINASKHEYTISGLYRGFAAKSQDPKEAASTYEFLIPDALDLKFDFERSRATFSTSRELSLSELAYAVDDMAELGGDFPFWGELEARDLENTKDFKRIRCAIEATDAQMPPGLAWFWLPEDRAFRIPLSVGGQELGTLLVVPSTAHCMCHSRFTLRILDPQGKLIWKEEDTAYASVRIALADDEELGLLHKIWLIRDDHGESAKFLIRIRLVEEKEIEQGVTPQSATRSESDTVGGDSPQPESKPRPR